MHRTHKGEHQRSQGTQQQAEETAPDKLHHITPDNPATPNYHDTPRPLSKARRPRDRRQHHAGNRTHARTIVTTTAASHEGMTSVQRLSENGNLHHPAHTFTADQDDGPCIGKHLPCVRSRSQE